ncbi:rps2 [Symbiodinium pilosum]|uniref:Rps2 protein n=1 Tax=Symbiodinium pilosum TaxID=2952 RepID=A0A812RZD7_SYMPI|nr:rps2 [Symbiodinium pilosum]
MEKVVRQQLHGRVQFQFASQHFFDNVPMASGMSRNKRDFGIFMNHDYDDMFYVRKFLEPAKFKKLALGNWEMPENATKSVTMRELVDAGAQYGHKSNKWNPAMLKYLYADNDGTHIFDLVQTAANLNRACYYVQEAAAKGASFILVGTKEQARPIVRKYGEEAGIHYTDLKPAIPDSQELWFVGGLISNFPVIRKAVELMQKLREEKAQGAWNIFSEFQRFRLTCKLERLTKKYHGVEEMTGYPDICIFVDEAKERHPIAEMVRIGVPCIGMVDSNNEPKFVDIAIPSNTSSTKSIDLVIQKLCESIKKGKA